MYRFSEFGDIQQGYNGLGSTFEIHRESKYRSALPPKGYSVNRDVLIRWVACNSFH